MKVKLEFEITKQQYEDLIGALGYSPKVISQKTGTEIDNPRTKEQVFLDALKEHVAYFLDMFVKQRIHTKLKKEEDSIRDKELRPVVDKMSVALKQ